MRRRACLWVWAAASGIASIAGAQVGNPAAPSGLERAATLRQTLSDARVGTSEHVKALRELVDVYEGAGFLRLATDTLKVYLLLAASPDRKALEQRLRTLAGRSRKEPLAVIEVKTSLVGARMSLGRNGRRVSLPTRLEVMGAPYELVMMAPGHDSRVLHTVIRPGEERQFVFDESGPASDASICVVRSSAVARSDLRVDGLPWAGPGDCQAASPGQHEVAVVGGALSFAVDVGKQPAVVWLRPAPPSGLVGAVFDANGRPVHRAQVSTAPPTATTWTRADGTFEITRRPLDAGGTGPLASGVYQLRVQHHAFKPGTIEVQVRDTPLPVAIQLRRRTDFRPDLPRRSPRHRAGAGAVAPER